ncbi:MAG TPA: hypothetical protein VH796_04615 [Nitrososphaeraceae archaeon]
MFRAYTTFAASNDASTIVIAAAAAAVIRMPMDTHIELGDI